MTMIKSFAAIVLASGTSSRLKSNKRKQYLKLNNGTVLSESVKPFLKSLELKELIITIPEDEEEQVAKNALYSSNEIQSLAKNTIIHFVKGGSTRQKSVYNALLKITTNPTVVLIHDAARPFVSEKIITDVAEKAFLTGASAPAIPPSDTQKIVDKDGIIKTHLEREFTRIIQTPQAFHFDKILHAHKLGAASKKNYTDDTEIFEDFVGNIYTVEGSVQNKKITYREDIQMNTMRIGFGYDMHKLVEGRPLVIGGVTIPFAKGEDAHSDGDVLLHAITDALLGASAMSDIGTLFPDTDKKWKDEKSSTLLSLAWEKIKECGYKIINIDCVIKLQEPKFIPYRKSVITSIAQILQVEENQIFVKAKTGEKLGDVGNGNAIEAWCSCLLEI